MRATAKLPRQSEKSFQAQVIQLAQFHRWLVYHTHDSRRSVAGFPDLVLVRGRACIVAELKVGTNYPSAEQAEWLDAFRAAGVVGYVWYPENWEKIVEVLS